MNVRILIALFVLLISLISPVSVRAMNTAEADMIAAAAERGSASAQVLLAVIYLNGMAGHAKDASQAAQWFERAAQQGNDYAQNMLGDLYAAGRGVPKNLQLAADWREKAARRGNVEAQYLLGKMYLEGAGVKSDPAQAAYWLNRAATEGDHADAQMLLSKMHPGGNADVKTPGLADNPLAQSAERSYADAAQLVQLLEAFGYKIKESLYKRPPDLEKLARDGDVDAQYQLALRYETGTHGLPQNNNQAVYWFKSAAQNGHTMAMKSLAHIYQNGLDGVAVDLKAARYWSEKALSQAQIVSGAFMHGPLEPAASANNTLLRDALGNDLVSFILSALMLVAYQIFLWHKTRQDPTYTVQAVNTFARTVWVETVMKGREQGVLAIQTLRNSPWRQPFWRRRRCC